MTRVVLNNYFKICVVWYRSEIEAQIQIHRYVRLHTAIFPCGVSTVYLTLQAAVTTLSVDMMANLVANEVDRLHLVVDKLSPQTMAMSPVELYFQRVGIR